MRILTRLSANYSQRTPDDTIDTLVLHYTGMPSAEESLARLTDTTAEVSSHYFIDEDGVVTLLVPEELKAWHAGVSCWRGAASVNNRSIGIEIQNAGHDGGLPPYPEKQILAVIELCQDILRRRAEIKQANIVGHSDIAPNRKQDPGEHFPWDKLGEQGVGLWPEALNHFPKRNAVLLFPGGEDDAQARQVQQRLQKFGYFLKADGKYGSKTEDVVRAFKRRFVRHNVSVSWDEHAEYALTSLESGAY